MHYTTTMVQMGNNTGIPVAADVLDQLGGGKRPAVKVVVNGYAYDSTVGSMGGQYLIPFSAAHRIESGISGGDEIEVELTLDTTPRTVELSADLAEALDAAGVRAVFDALAPSKRKAHVTAVASAKAAETRERRIAAIVAGLR